MERVTLSSDALRAIRTRLHLTQTGLADALGVHLRTVKHWELGTRPIPAIVWVACRALLHETAPEPDIKEGYRMD